MCVSPLLRAVFNAITVQPLIAAERIVFYRGEPPCCSFPRWFALGHTVPRLWQGGPGTACLLLLRFCCSPPHAPPLAALHDTHPAAERAASMYAPGPYSLALGLAEVPYLIAQSLVMVNITYW